MAKARRCSFCGKSEDEGAVLVAGPGLFICDGCIKLSDALLDHELDALPPGV